MNQLAQILAVFIAVAHLAFLLWPRKPLEVQTDETGAPILWCNENAERRDVACVWGGETGEANPTATVGEEAEPANATAFREAVVSRSRAAA